MRTLAIAALLVTTSALLVGVGRVEAIWIEQTVPFVPGLRCVDAVDESVVWAAGVDGTVVVTSDAGSSWSHWPAPSTTLTAIHAFDDQSCIVGSDSGQIFRTTDGGVNWVEVGLFGAAIHDIQFFDGASGCAVGDPIGGSFLVVTTSDGGSTWTTLPTAPPAAPGMHGYMGSCAWSGQMLGLFGTNQDVVWRTTDAGSTWTQVATNQGLVRGLVLGDGGIGLAGGDQGEFDRSTDAGATWVAVPFPDPMALLHAFDWVEGTGQVWALGRFEAASISMPYRSTDAGASWTGQTVPVDFHAFDLAYPTDRTGWVVGEFQGFSMARIFKWTEVAEAVFTDVTPENMWQPIGDRGRNGAWGDYDADGDVDLLVAVDGANALFRNNGDLTFDDVASGPLLDPVQTWPASWADYDNDGDLDLFCSNGGSPSYPSADRDQLLRHDGAGVFTDVTADSLTFPTQGWGFQWGDFDLDGDLDLYVIDNRIDVADRMFRNDGGDSFALVPAGDASGLGPSITCSVTDIDLDGDLDIHVSRWETPNLLLRNDGDFQFVDIAPDLGLADSGISAGGQWGDYDNDGDLDFFLCNYWGTGSSLYKNNGGSGFEDVIAASGIEELNQPQAAWFDFNNDGYLDLYFGNHGGPDRLYMNEGNGHFIDVAAGALQSGHFTSYPALADFDGDGDVDYFNQEAGGGTVLLLRNDNGAGNHWLHVKLVGDPDSGSPGSNVSAIGARVRLEAGGMTQIRQVESPIDLAQSSLTVEFGLGNATSIDRLEVRWPSGLLQEEISPAFLDQHLTWVEGGHPWPTSSVGAAGQPVACHRLHANRPNPFNPSTVLDYELAAASDVRLRIYDVMGRSVRILEDGVRRAAGLHTVRWDGRDDRGRAVASGVYYYRIEAGVWTETRPMVLVR
jgi:photosystem II stability/assembly factor-like uncharacterized protein